MSRWIDVPAHRVLAITNEEMANQFERLNADGEPARFGECIALIRRKRDGKVFKYPRYHAAFDEELKCSYLEEV